MTNLTRWVLWVAWLAAVGWAWHAGALGTGSALVTGSASLLLFAWHPHRKRRSALRYIEMGKQPTGLY